MVFTDDDLKNIKAEYGIYEDPIGCADIKLFALIARLEAAEACIPRYFGDVCECIEICERHDKARDAWCKSKGE